MPACDYVTASSEDIARAYAQCLGIPEPVTVLNSFPLSDRTRPVDAVELMRERDARAISLYWFSQTIGPGRGLEAAIDALPLLDPRCVLTLRGAWAPGFEAQLRARALALQVEDRLRHLPPCPPAELVRRAQCHDVGLAIESPRTINHDLCLSNKIFTYLMAAYLGATDTMGQRRFCRAFRRPRDRPLWTIRSPARDRSLYAEKKRERARGRRLGEAPGSPSEPGPCRASRESSTGGARMRRCSSFVRSSLRSERPTSPGTAEPAYLGAAAGKRSSRDRAEAMRRRGPLLQRTTLGTRGS